MACPPHLAQTAAWYSRGPPSSLLRLAACRQPRHRCGSLTNPLLAKNACSPDEKVNGSPQVRQVRVRSWYTLGSLALWAPAINLRLASYYSPDGRVDTYFGIVAAVHRTFGGRAREHRREGLGNRSTESAVRLAMHTLDRARPARLLTSVLTVTGALALAACSAAAPPGGASGSPSPAASPSQPVGVEHPTEATEIILRMTEGGGFVPMGFAATEMPAFTLYGDGTVVYRAGGLPAAGGSSALPPLKVARMSEDQIATLVEFALETGGLADARERYDHPLVADAPTTTFDIDAGGTTKSVSIYAVGLTDADQPDAAERTKFNRLAEALRNFANDVERGRASDEGEYEPTAYRAILIEGGMGGEMRDWPWEELEPADFQVAGDLGFRSTVVTPEQAEELTDDPRGGFLGVGVTGPDKAPYTIALRPLLPDEDR